MDKIPCVYILTNKRNGTLYTGVTSNLPRRIEEHRSSAVDGFTKRYALHTLVYFEVCDDMRQAIERERQIKGGSRARKLALIEKGNPRWLDLTYQL